ncbi:FCD domain-containing protein, partial [Acidimicrobiaceae bacterium USS-CC1]|nr:FCD domain-containing protein [Acidiferrimicrobium australe]
LGVSPTPVREALRRLEQDGLVERVSARQLRVVERSPETLRELLLTAAVLRALEARFATAKITDAALDRMAALVDSLTPDGRRANAEYLRIAREFDQEIERAAGNPTLRGLIQSLSILGQGRRDLAVQSMRQRREVARSRIQGHRDILVALRARDPDAVEAAVRRHATTGVDLLLGEL